MEFGSNTARTAHYGEQRLEEGKRRVRDGAVWRDAVVIERQACPPVWRSRGAACPAFCSACVLAVRGKNMQDAVFRTYARPHADPSIRAFQLRMERNTNLYDRDKKVRLCFPVNRLGWVKVCTASYKRNELMSVSVWQRIVGTRGRKCHSHITPRLLGFSDGSLCPLPRVHPERHGKV